MNSEVGLCFCEELAANASLSAKGEAWVGGIFVGVERDLISPCATGETV